MSFVSSQCPQSEPEPRQKSQGHFHSDTELHCAVYSVQCTRGGIPKHLSVMNIATEAWFTDNIKIKVVLLKRKKIAQILEDLMGSNISVLWPTGLWSHIV